MTRKEGPVVQIGVASLIVLVLLILSSLNVYGQTARAETPFPRIVVPDQVLDDMLRSPSQFVDGVACTSASTCSAAAAHGYVPMFIIGGGIVCEYWPGSWQAVADLVKIGAATSSLVQFDEFQARSDHCGKGYDGGTFNMLRNAARTANPNVLVGFVEPTQGFFEETLGSGASPDFVFGEAYVGWDPHIYQYLREQKGNNRGGSLKHVGMWFSDRSTSIIPAVLNDGDSVEALELKESQNWAPWRWIEMKTAIENHLVSCYASGFWCVCPDNHRA